MDITVQEAREISKEAYIFFQSMIDQYSLRQLIGSSTPENEIHVPEDIDSPGGFPYKCKDQVYGPAFLNLQEEPYILKVPNISSDLYFSVMCVDQYGHNFAYFGTVTTGNNQANYLIAGPNWTGTAPNGVKAVAVSEGFIVYMVLRLEVKNPEDPNDIKQAREILKMCALKRLSEFTGSLQPPPLPPPNFPPYDSNLLTKAEVFTYVNAFSKYIKIHCTEEDMFARFAKIGVVPGAPFPPEGMKDAIYEAIQQGVWEGNIAVESELKRQLENKVDGWLYTTGIKPPLVGSREVMQDRYLARAGMARNGFKWGNDIQEAVYIQTFHDNCQHPLDGANKYEMNWSAGEQPPVKAFWSLTMYDEQGSYIDNSLNRYSIGSNTPGLVFNSDNSLTIYIQNSTPDASKLSNWLPCPRCDGFQVFLRMYRPKDVLFDGKYAPPRPEIM